MTELNMKVKSPFCFPPLVLFKWKASISKRNPFLTETGNDGIVFSNHWSVSETLEFEQGGLRDVLPVTRLVLGQSSSPLVRWGKNHHHPPSEACEQLQLVTACREEDVALDNTEREIHSTFHPHEGDDDLTTYN